MMNAKLAVALLEIEQYRTKKQQYYICYTCYLHKKTNVYQDYEYLPIIIQDLNDFFVRFQKFCSATKKIAYHLFMLLILPNIVLD